MLYHIEEETLVEFVIYAILFLSMAEFIYPCTHVCNILITNQWSHLNLQSSTLAFGSICYIALVEILQLLFRIVLSFLPLPQIVKGSKFDWVSFFLQSTPSHFTPNKLPQEFRQILFLFSHTPINCYAVLILYICWR